MVVVVVVVMMVMVEVMVMLCSRVFRGAGTSLTSVVAWAQRFIGCGCAEPVTA